MTTTASSTFSPLTYAAIDLEAIRHNFIEICTLAQKRADHTTLDHVDIIPVIKSEAYGHGLLPVAQTLADHGVSWLAVSNPFEAIKLRESGLDNQQILLLESTLASQAELIVDYDLIPTICTTDLVEAIARYASLHHKMVKVHIKVDTGMSRFGIPIEEAINFITFVRQFSSIQIHGLYTHFPMADSDSAFTQEQVSMMVSLLKQLEERGIHIPFIHAANSMGLVGYRNYAFNLARTGLMLYGVYPRDDFHHCLYLKPTMSIHTQIVFIKPVKKGEGISYGYSYIAQEDMVIAVLPIGYADGYFRHMSNKAQVLIDGQRCSVVGRITMDQIMVDITSIKNSSVGMDVVVMGQQGDQHVTADELAGWADTIPYEIMCNLGARLEKKYKR